MKNKHLAIIRYSIAGIFILGAGIEPALQYQMKRHNVTKINCQAYKIEDYTILQKVYDNLLVLNCEIREIRDEEEITKIHVGEKTYNVNN